MQARSHTEAKKNAAKWQDGNARDPYWAYPIVKSCRLVKGMNG